MKIFHWHQSGNSAPIVDRFAKPPANHLKNVKSSLLEVVTCAFILSSFVNFAVLKRCSFALVQNVEKERQGKKYEIRKEL